MVSAALATPHSPKSFTGKREEGEERGDTSGLGKEGGGQAAREGRERLEDRLETTRLAGRRGGEETSVCTGEGTLQPLPDS